MKKLLLVALTATTLLLIPNKNQAQAPTLGTTSTFALFTSVGAFSNVGASVVTGDAGTNVGPFTGFPPGVLIGQVHATDPTSVVAAIDVAVAYSSLAGVTCDTVIGTTLGNNQVLTPNVYCLGAASVLNGNLILDAQGDPKALFIFKIDGALSTNTFSNVVLINNASLCNVYWQINGAVALGDSSVFSGTILANGALSLNSGSTLNGRGLTIAGAISVSAATVNIANCCYIQIWTKKENCPQDSTGKLTAHTFGTGPYTYLWNDGSTNRSIRYYSKGLFTVTVTDNGTNGCSATMVKSKRALTLRPIIFLQTKIEPSCLTCCDGAVIITTALGGTAPYTFLWSDGNTNSDRIDFCKGIYTITITDSRGCTASIRKNFGKNLRTTDSQFSNSFDIQVSPNPNNGNINLNIETENDADLNLKVIDITGRTLSVEQLTIAAGASALPLNYSYLPSGIYYLNISNNLGSENIKFIKN